MTERNIRLLVAYDGTDFCGWQRQAEERTVQGVLEDALETMHKHPVTTHAAGRTDSGVHAAGQVAGFLSDIGSIPEEKYAHALNALLPTDVRILSSREVGGDFHPRFSARSREYRYYIYPTVPCPPYVGRYSWAMCHRPNLRRLNACAAVLLGELDFATFTASGDTSASTVRKVTEASFFMEGPRVVFRIRANAFLMKMVRSLVGTMIQLDRNQEGPASMERLLRSKDRSLAGETAPPRGLFLHEVLYND